MNCRINKQRIWAARIQLEAQFHIQSCFVTLTYNDDHCPKQDGVEVLYRRHFRLWVGRLRELYRAENSTFRFFGCGEYGIQSNRPHYHAVLFGVGVNAEPQIHAAWHGEGEHRKCSLGFTQVAELTPERCAYVAQYTLKKMTAPDARGLGGRPPEFATMSTRPGIGLPAIPWLGHVASSAKGWKTILEAGDVWTSVRIGGRIWPLGSYLRRKLRDYLGIPNDARERAIYFGHYDHATGELIELPPLPDGYTPWQDIADYSTPWNIAHAKKAHKEELPEVQRDAEARRRKASKRKKKGSEV